MARDRGWTKRLGAALAGAMLALSPAVAEAQPTNNDFAVDLFQGPLLAPIRVLSMGGAYAGYAEGIAGFVANAASPAVRHTHSSGWWDADIDASISIPIPLFGNNDFDNSGDIDADYSNFLYLSAGGLLQAGPFGAGFFGDLQQFNLSFPPSDETLQVTVGRYHLLGAWMFLGGQVVAGAGGRALTLSAAAPGGDITILGVSPQVGVLVKPDWTPFRIGLTYRHQVNASLLVGDDETVGTDGVRRAGRLVIPARAELPWELEAGFALQVGARPLNPRWIHPDEHEAELRAAYHERAVLRGRRWRARLAAAPNASARAALREALRREAKVADERDRRRMERDLERLRDERRARAKNWPRESLLLTADLLVTGQVEGAIGLEPFLSQGQAAVVQGPCRTVASGESINFSPRVGVEMEPIAGYVHTRFGTYYEPNRFTYQPSGCSDRVGRQHFTFGADVRLFKTTWFGLVPEVTYKLQGYGDLAPRYQSFGAGFGVWY